MKMLPALVEKDISAFGESINDAQRIGFKKIEVELQNPGVRRLLKICQENSYGAGLSSFGPAIYSLVDGEKRILKKVGSDAQIIFTNADNIGVKRFD
jgi:beta-ribofuranosylaminobenzene 5'-phosphate synthase